MVNISPGLIFIFFAITFILSSANHLFAQDDSFLNTLEIGGFAEVKNNNQAAAKEKAVKDAIRKAVEETVESMVLPEILVANYSWISNIYHNSEDYMHSYRFLSESFDEENNLYSVALRITLYSRYIRSLLASNNLLENSLSIPQKVLFIIKERGLLSSNEEDFWSKIPQSEVFLAEKLLSKGINVINRNDLRDKVDIELIRKSLKGDVQAAIQVGLLTNANIVIIGNAVARQQRGESLEDSTMANYQANISLKAYQTETGKILGARSEFITIANEDPELGELNALMAAGEKIYNNFLAGIIFKDDAS